MPTYKIETVGNEFHAMLDLDIRYHGWGTTEKEAVDSLLDRVKGKL